MVVVVHYLSYSVPGQAEAGDWSDCLSVIRSRSPCSSLGTLPECICFIEKKIQH